MCTHGIQRSVASSQRRAAVAALLVPRRYIHRYHGSQGNDEVIVKARPFTEIKSMARDFHARSQAGQADMRHASECLRAAHIYMKSTSRTCAAGRSLELGLGGQVMQWLRHSANARYCGDVDQGFAEQLLWFVVVENHQDAFRDWLKELHQHGAAAMILTKESSLPDCCQWTRYLLGGYIHALLELAPAGNPNTALKAFLALLDLNHPEHVLPILCAATVLARHLQTSSCPPCDATLFDTFVRAAGASGPINRVPSMRAQYHLFHPAQPEAFVYWRLVATDDPYLGEDRLKSLRPSSKGALAYGHLRAAYILRVQGHEGEARQLEEVVERSNRLVWDRRNVYYERELDRDQKLRKIRLDHKRSSQRASKEP